MSAAQLADIEGSVAPPPMRIDAVGVSRVRHPIVIVDRTQTRRQTVATITMSVDVAATTPGVHLNRFLEVLAYAADELTMHTAPRLLDEVRTHLGATAASVDAEFPYFIERRAPMSGARELLDVTCCLSFRGSPGDSLFVLSVTVPVMTLCGCGQTIRGDRPHEQRCDLTISVGRRLVEDPPTDQMIWIEDLVDLAERHSWAPNSRALQWTDERFVTSSTDDDPASAEDVVRGIAATLQRDPRVESFYVEASSDESVHNYRAFARIGSSPT